MIAESFSPLPYLHWEGDLATCEIQYLCPAYGQRDRAEEVANKVRSGPGGVSKTYGQLF